MALALLGAALAGWAAAAPARADAPGGEPVAVTAPAYPAIALARASAEASAPGHEAELAIDGDPGTYWDASLGTGNGVWWKAEMDRVHDVDRVVVRTYADGTRYYRYRVETSLDGTTWTTAAEKTDDAIATSSGTVHPIGRAARYVKVTMTFNSANNSVHLAEFAAYGSPSDELTSGKRAWADDSEAGHGAELAIDADATNASYWSAYVNRQAATQAEDGEYWYVDLAGDYRIDAVSVRQYVDGSRSYTYSVQASRDGLHWHPVAAKTDFRAATDVGDWYAAGGVQARYLRMHMTGNTANDAVHLSDFEAYGGPVRPYAEAVRWSMEDDGARMRDGAGDADGVPIDAVVADGFRGRALQFDGVRSRLAIDRPDLPGPWTAAFWVYRQDSPNAAAILMESAAASLRLEQEGGANKAGFTLYGTADYTFDYTVPLQTWTHLAYVSDGAGMKLYADGTLVGSVPNAAVPLPMRSLGAAFHSMKGRLDEVRLFDRALTDAQIAELVDRDALRVEAQPDEPSYAAGERVTMSLRLSNGSAKPITAMKVTARIVDPDLPQPLADVELASGVTVAPGQSVELPERLLRQLGTSEPDQAYAVRLFVHRPGGAVDEFDGGFFRVGGTGALHTYEIERFTHGGVPVYALDGGMSAEYTVEKALENLSAGTSHSWYVSGPGQGPNPVRAEPSFLKQSVERTTSYYDQWLGANTPFDTVIVSTGVASVPYLSRAMKAPVLPLHYLASVDGVFEVETMLKQARKDGMRAYATIGHDGSVPDAGVAWIKLLSVPQAYIDFLVRHQVRHVVFVGSEGLLGETTAKRIVSAAAAASESMEPADGDMYVIYPNKGSSADLAELRTKLPDLGRYSLEGKYRKASDWESGIVRPQIAAFVDGIRSGTPIAAMTGLFDQVGNLYEAASRIMLDFYKKNEAVLTAGNPGSLPVRGIVLNPYLIAHPFYESRIGYVPYLFWQGNDPASVANDFVAVNLKRTILSRFPNAAVEQLPVWIDATNNFGGYRAEALRDALLAAGFANVETYDRTADEVWADDGKTAPVERIAQQLAAAAPGELQAWDDQLAPLTPDDIAKYGESLIEPGPNERIGLLASWRFDEPAATAGAGTDRSAAADGSGNGRDATIRGAVRTSAGKSGGALRFDGDDDVVYTGLPDSAATWWTAALWVKREDNPNSSSVLFNSGEASVRLEQASFSNRVGLTDYAASADYTFDYEAPVGQWTHLAFVGTPAGTTLYVNGQPRDTIAAAIPLPADTIGHSFNSLKGTVDEIKLFGKALPPEAIQSLYEGLFLQLDFEQTVGNAVYDASGLSHSGMLSGVSLAAAGKHGNGAVFDGLDSHIRLDRANVHGPWTAAMWVKRADSPHRSAKLLVSPSTSLALEQEGYTNRLGFTRYGVADYTFTYEAPVGVWTHVAFVSDGSSVSLYANGVLQQSIASDIPLPLQYVGNTYYPLEGTIDDLHVYERALGASEIAALAVP
ncbi:hypothetical protein DLM86_16860 [Paenibacillus flagellatus]|uniref:F5/8 type C domain-containing protein n=2 Tax=Paenibacillus flagellatus TaxID=2211139 RepID=A0A2V5K684_9BACL|nr:hypothetical protein DLM86_16860 [Paenibacillus flagellatus]